MIDPMEHRWAQHVAVTTFRCRHGTAPPDILGRNWRAWSMDGRTTSGASGNYVPYRSSSTSRTVSSSNRAYLIWNSLPNELQAAGFIFMRLSSLAMPWIAIFARKCDCYAMVNSLAIAPIAISTRNLRLRQSLHLYVATTVINSLSVISNLFRCTHV